LPGLRPDLPRDERFFAGFFNHGASEDGGRDEFDESPANRRSSSATRSVNAASTRSNSVVFGAQSGVLGPQPSVFRTQHGVLRSELSLQREVGHDDTLARAQQ
jgi:hypothetical protein